MKNTLLQGIISIVLFFILFFAFSMVDWVTLLGTKQKTEKLEVGLGDLILKELQKTETEIHNPFVQTKLDSLMQYICKSNNLLYDDLKLHIFDNAEVNAFALPNQNIIVYSGLIENADNQEEVIGVLCHELAHLELNHVMKKLVKEIGLSVLASLVGGTGGIEIASEVLKVISSSAFDRNFEKEADIKAVDYMIKSGINPIPFADFMYKLSLDDSKFSKYMSWTSTHPDSKDRAKYIIEYSKGKAKEYTQFMTTESWEKFKRELQ